MNKITIIGHLTRDPELKTGVNGNEFCTFTVAVNRRGANGEKAADFFNCIAFKQTAAAVAKYMTKGRQIAVCGSMESNTVEKDGQKKTYWEIKTADVEFLGSKNDDRSAAPADGFTEVTGDVEDPF